MVRFTAARTDADLHHILDLQARNLPEHLSATEVREQGFVTVRHDLDLLRRMNARGPHAVAWRADTLAGYALVMVSEFRSQIPVLRSMFERIDTHTIDGRALRDLPYCVMGQVCVAKPFRGRGVFDGLYTQLDHHLVGRYEYLVTLIASRNPRSLRAHERIGFRLLERYRDEREAWNLVVRPVVG